MHLVKLVFAYCTRLDEIGLVDIYETEIVRVMNSTILTLYQGEYFFAMTYFSVKGISFNFSAACTSSSNGFLDSTSTCSIQTAY